MAVSQGLDRTLGLPALVFYGVGLILGAGVYSVIGTATADAGGAVWLSFLLGAAVAGLTALSYAELATAYPQAGAEYVYVRRALPGVPALAPAVGVVIVIAAAAMATTVAVAFAGYLAAFTDLPRWPIAIGLLVAVGALAIAGLRFSTWLNVAFTLIEAAGLIAIVALGLTHPGFPGALALPDAAALPGVMAGAALVFFAYLGFEDLANLVEETRRPARSIPRALLISVAITATLYVLVGIAVVGLVPPERLAGSDAPLALAAHAAGPGWGRAVGAVALFATANTALVTILAASRMVYGMAKGRDLPARLRTVGRRKTPWIATLVVVGAAIALVPVGDLGVVAGLSSFAALVAFAAVNLSLIVLRFRDPRRPRPFRVPLAIGRVPVLPVAGVLSTGLLIASFDRTVYVAGAIACAIAVTVVLVARRRA
jgi:basic amino acid/polyamine antiporter, APA family